MPEAELARPSRWYGIRRPFGATYSRLARREAPLRIRIEVRELEDDVGEFIIDTRSVLNLVGLKAAHPGALVVTREMIESRDLKEMSSS